MHVLLTLILFLKFTFLDTKSVMKKEVEAEEEEVAALKHAVGVKNLPLFLSESLSNPHDVPSPV